MPVIFEIYRDGRRVSAFEPVAAVAIGPESVPVPGKVVFHDGLLVVDTGEDHAVGVALLWDLGPLGQFVQETTRLQPRERPYNLNVEMARFRLMKIVQKLEDWNLFEFPRGEKYQQQFQQAQELLAEALGKLHEPPEAAGVADQALALAVDLSEQLSLFHADLLIGRRRSSNHFARHIFGCRIDPQIRNQKYRDTLAGSFDYAVVPMTWREMQPQEHAFETAAVDEWIELLNRRRLPIIAGPLVRLREPDVPDWLFIWEHDFDTLRELSFEHVQRVVLRYRRAVGVWNVVAGLGSGHLFPLSFEQIIELTRLLISHVKNLIPNARTLVTITQPFGEYHAEALASVPPILYAEMVAQAGINFDGFGLELELGLPRPGQFMRDLFQVSCMLDRFAAIGRPVFLTAVAAPGRTGVDPQDRSGGCLDPAMAGRWHRPWDPQLQAEWIHAVYHVAMSKPYVESIAWSDLADITQSMPGSGLVDDMLRPKASFEKLQQVRTQFHQWMGRKVG